MRHRVRCTDCCNWIPIHSRCTALARFVDHPRHWRRCEAYRAPPSPPSVDEAWQELLDTGLDYFVDTLADIGNGQRMLRLKANVEADERFKVYQAIGLRVDESTGIRERAVKRQSNGKGQAYQGETAA